jgi:outer membrane protein OmpA-like peptidoglycan-associated protein
LPWLTLEGTALVGPSEPDTASGLEHNYSFFGADLRWNLRPAESRVVPFLLTGMAIGRSHAAGHPPDQLERGSPSLGLGVLFNVYNPRTYVRLQVRDQMFRERDAREFSNHLAITAGVQLVLLGRQRDQDLDGVRDWLDRCPNTPIGAAVGRNGCPSDADRDSIFDGIDQCADTPPGCRVDAKGCPIDQDGDKVCDGVDQCADTPPGCTVDARGCPVDSDADGVCDGVDQCPGTAPGCPVDAQGCTTDGDSDGVCDSLDVCPNTPAGIPVGPTGCPLEIGALERDLLDAGVLRVRRVVFEPGQSEIDSSAALDSIGVVIQQYPNLRIEIGGPTDVRGKAAERERLSLDQARAVLDYIRNRHPAVSPSQITLRGYAVPPEGLPPVPEAERLRGRRIEFKVINVEALDVERERRGLPKRGE